MVGSRELSQRRGELNGGRVATVSASNGYRGGAAAGVCDVP
jgi:hypothetical protein